MLAEVFTIVLILTMVGTLYGIVLQLIRPLLEKKIASYHLYKLFKWGILFFCIPFGIIICMLGKWIGIELNQILLEKNLTAYSAPLTLDNSIFTEISYPILDMDYEKSNLFIKYLPYIWLIGVVVLAAGRLTSQVIYMKKIKNTSFLIKEGEIYQIFNDCREELGIWNQISIHLWSNDRINIPFGTGFFRYNIWIPEKTFSNQELRFIFLHELSHVLHGDLFMKYIVLIANGIHWYNPFFYFYNKEINLLCELACDEEVVKHLYDDNLKDYGMLLIDLPKRKAMNYIALCPNSSDIKTRLYKIANPVFAKKSSYLCTLLIGGILSCTMVSISVMGQQAIEPWKEKFVQNEGNVTSYQNYLEAENKQYQSFGLIYHKDISAFYYKGQRVKVFLDERHIAEWEKEIYPWMDKAWQNIHVDSDSDSRLYLKTVRDMNNEISKITFLNPKEAEAIINKNVNVVTFHSTYIGSNGFYASDRFEQGLPEEVMFLEKKIKKHMGGLLKRSNDKEVSGYIYYNGGQFPWKIDMGKDGVMKVKLYTLDGGEKGKPTIIHLYRQLR